MKDVKKVFNNLERQLRKSNWFSDDWDIYNRGVYMQLYKHNWCNQNQGGVHFETYIESREIRQKEFPICMHAEEDCPQQERFIQEFLALEANRISSWKGYKAVGKGYVICQRNLPLNFKNLEQRLLEEFNRLRQLEVSINQTLSLVDS